MLRHSFKLLQDMEGRKRDNMRSDHLLQFGANHEIAKIVKPEPIRLQQKEAEEKALSAQLHSLMCNGINLIRGLVSYGLSQAEEDSYYRKLEQAFTNRNLSEMTAYTDLLDNAFSNLHRNHLELNEWFESSKLQNENFLKLKQNAIERFDKASKLFPSLNNEREEYREFIFSCTSAKQFRESHLEKVIRKAEKLDSLMCDGIDHIRELVSLGISENEENRYYIALLSCLDKKDVAEMSAGIDELSKALKKQQCRVRNAIAEQKAAMRFYTRLWMQQTVKEERIAVCEPSYLTGLKLVDELKLPQEEKAIYLEELFNAASEGSQQKLEALCTSYTDKVNEKRKIDKKTCKVLFPEIVELLGKLAPHEKPEAATNRFDAFELCYINNNAEELQATKAELITLLDQINKAEIKRQNFKKMTDQYVPISRSAGIHSIFQHGVPDVDAIIGNKRIFNAGPGL